MNRTAGRVLELGRRADGELPTVEIWLDGRWVGAVGVMSWSDEEHGLAELADRLREHSLDEEVWGGWPICPLHSTHPLDPVVVAGVAVWACGEAGTVAAIGELPK